MTSLLRAEMTVVIQATRKNFLLGWRRKRTRQVIIPLLFYSMYILFFGSNKEMAAGFGDIFGYIIPMAMFAICQMQLIDIVQEKESKMKEIMHIYGVSHFAYYVSWIAVYWLYAVFSMCFMLGMLLVLPWAWKEFVNPDTNFGQTIWKVL